MAACKLRPGMTVANVGAGTGLFTRLFAAEVGPKGRVYAVDIARKFIEHIEKTSQEAGLQNVTGVVCTPTSTELPPNSVDLVFICDAYHHFEYPQKTMASVHRALRPGGRLVLINFRRIEGKTPDWLLKHVRAGQEVFTKEVEAAGFKVMDQAGFLKDNYFVRFEWVEPPQAARGPTAAVIEPKNLLKEGDGLEFRFSYFPSLDRLRLLVLGCAAQFVKWEAVLSPQGKSEVLARREGKLPFADAGETIRVPRWATGRTKSGWR